MRATTHFARTTKGGKAFSSKHNDRNYSEELKPDNVIAEKSKDNSYHFCWFENEPQDKIKTFEDHEKWVYKNFLGQFFEEQNERNRKARHLERVKTLEQFRKMARYCPEEVLWYIGKKGESATAQQLENLAKKQIAWEEKKYPGLKYLDWAVHVDELGAPHVQARRIWTYDKNGVVAVGQNKALEQMGVALPHPNEPISESNNRKITYTAESRDTWIAYAEGIYNFEIERTPKKNNGHTLSEWQAEQDIDKQYKTLSDAQNDLSERAEEQNRQITLTNSQIDAYNESVERLNYAQNFEKRAAEVVVDMVSQGKYSEKSDSKQLFGALKTVSKMFVSLKNGVSRLLKMPLNQVIAQCIKAQQEGYENLQDYLFPKVEKQQKIEPIKTQKKTTERGGRGGR